MIITSSRQQQALHEAHVMAVPPPPAALGSVSKELTVDQGTCRLTLRHRSAAHAKIQEYTPIDISVLDDIPLRNDQ
jgi:hypothetical protein